MNEYETDSEHSIAETCADPVTLEQLYSLDGDLDLSLAINTRQKLTYGSIRGSKLLCTNLATQYPLASDDNLSYENILVTNGAIQANLLLLYTLIGEGDHVICHYPTYQQLYSVPKSLKAEVSLWKSDPDAKWSPSIEGLRELIRPNTKIPPNTKMIILK